MKCYEVLCQGGCRLHCCQSAGMSVAARLTKGLEDRAVERVFLATPFRMPLHSIGKCFCTCDLNGFDQTVGRISQSAQPRRKNTDTLTVQ